MKEISLANIHENPQYFSIIEELIIYRKGLTLHEMMYLLSKKTLTKFESQLEEKFGKKNRKDIFKTRQRLCDCLRKLKEEEEIGIVYKTNRTYHLDLPTIFYWLDVKDATEEYNKKMKKAEEDRKKITKILDDVHPDKKAAIEREITPKTIERRFKKLWKKLKIYY